MQRVPQEEFDDHLPAAQLLRQLFEGPLVRIARHSEGQLLAQLLSQLHSEAVRGPVVHAW